MKCERFVQVLNILYSVNTHGFVFCEYSWFFHKALKLCLIDDPNTELFNYIGVIYLDSAKAIDSLHGIMIYWPSALNPASFTTHMCCEAIGV